MRSDFRNDCRMAQSMILVDTSPRSIIPHNEAARMRAVRRYDILNIPAMMCLSAEGTTLPEWFDPFGGLVLALRSSAA
jgi:hypothetical protein